MISRPVIALAAALSGLALALFAAMAGAETITWTRQFGTAGSDFALGIARDANGQHYVVGFTEGALPGQTWAGGLDAFIRKYDVNGQEVWTRQFGTPGTDMAVAVDVYKDHVFVAGFVGDGALAGCKPLPCVSAGGADGFVSKYTQDGVLVWTRQFGTAANDDVQGLAVDSGGGVIVGGSTLGAFPGFSSAGGVDAFVVRYTAAGVYKWTDQFGTAETDQILSVAVRGTGKIYVAGLTRGTLADCEPDACASAGGFDAFVRRYDASGDVVWTRQFGSSGFDEIWGLAVENDGDVYAAGGTGGTLTECKPDPCVSAGGFDAFVRKYSSNGRLQWTRQFGTSADDEAFSVAVDTDGNVYAGGVTGGEFPGQTTAGGFDGFVRKFNSAGTPKWTIQLGSDGYDDIGGVTVTPSGVVHVAGSTTGALTAAPSAGGEDAFIMEIVP